MCENMLHRQDFFFLFHEKIWTSPMCIQTVLVNYLFWRTHVNAYSMSSDFSVIYMTIWLRSFARRTFQRTSHSTCQGRFGACDHISLKKKMSRHEIPSPELQKCHLHRGHWGHCGQTGALVWFNEYFETDLDTEQLPHTCWSIPWEERHWNHPGLAVQGKESVLHLDWMSDVNMKDSSNDPVVLPIVSAFHFTSMSLCIFFVLPEPVV